MESAAGDAASALGNLVSLLESSGTVLVAARQAYFDYKSLDTQARLFDSLSGQSVSFARVRLQRWDGSQFVSYAGMRGLAAPDAVYARLAEHLGPGHPLLTRAVLASRIVELALDAGDIDSLTERLDAGASDHFGELVRPILQREALKWIDKSGEPYHPLLSPDEHFILLETLALEMWNGETAIVPAEILEWSAEVFCSSNRKSSATTRQVLERIKQHALLANRGGSSRGAYQFDHEEFYHYFLGRGIAVLLSSNDDTAAKAALRRTTLPQLAIDTAAVTLRGPGMFDRAISLATRVCRTEPAASFVRENVGAILIKSVPESSDSAKTIDGLAFPVDSLKARSMSNTVFVNCDFAETDIDEGFMDRIEFRLCRFDVLYLTSPRSLQGVTLNECHVRALAGPASSVPTYDPKEIESVLARLAGHANIGPGPDDDAPTEVDEALWHTERVLRRFLRSTEINENVIRQASGQYANQFFRDVLPVLERNSIVREVSYIGSGHQRRYRLGRPLQQLSDSLKRSSGDFQRFVQLASVHG